MDLHCGVWLSVKVEDIEIPLRRDCEQLVSSDTNTSIMLG